MYDHLSHHLKSLNQNLDSIIKWDKLFDFKLPEQVIKECDHHVKQSKIIQYQNLSERYIEDIIIPTIKSKIIWTNLTKYQSLSEEFIRKHFKFLNIEYIAKYQKISENFVKEHYNLYNANNKRYRTHRNRRIWISIFTNQSLSIDFLDTCLSHELHEFHYKAIATYQNLSEQIIEKHINKFPPFWISKCQCLSDKFIQSHQDYINWNILPFNTNISIEVRSKYVDRVNPTIKWDPSRRKIIERLANIQQKEIA